MPLKGHRGQEARETRLWGAAAPTRSPNPAQNHFRVGTRPREASEPPFLRTRNGRRSSAPTPPPPSARLHALPQGVLALLAALPPTHHLPGATRAGRGRKDRDRPPRLGTGSARTRHDCFRRLCPSARGRPPPPLDAHTSTRRGGNGIPVASACLW